MKINRKTSIIAAVSVAATMVVAVSGNAAGGRNASGSVSVFANSMVQDSDTVDTIPASELGTELSEPKRGSIVDEVIWVVGDEPILRSDVEAMRLQGSAEGHDFGPNADCSIPEQLAVQKLFLHQAALDSIEVTESEITQGVDQQINYLIQMAGSRERLEQYLH